MTYVQDVSPSTPMLWIGWVMSGIVIFFMLMDGGMKLVPLDIVTKTGGELGLPTTVEYARTLGLVLLISTALYAYPRTAVLGAILLTGYLGGAISTHLRVGSPLFTHTLFGLYLGLLAWGGLYLRSAGLRALIPYAV